MPSFQSAGKRVSIDHFAPNASHGKHPAVIFVHGADGLQLEWFRDWYRRHAEALAAKGYEVFFPHYMDATATKRGDEAKSHWGAHAPRMLVPAPRRNELFFFGFQN